MIHLIEEIVEVKPFKLTLKFNTGEIRTVDLEKRLKEWSRSPDSKFKALLNPAFFKTVKLHRELETIYWDNGIDFCPDVLYGMSVPASEPTKLAEAEK